MTNELLELLPNHDRASGNKAFYEKELAREAEQKADKMLRGDDGSPDLDVTQHIIDDRPYTGMHNVQERRTYELLCRGQLEPLPEVLAKLKCRYVTNKSPFLKIAPLKLEEASLTPYIVVYRDVIYDGEIELIKQMAKPRVSILTVKNFVFLYFDFLLLLSVPTGNCSKPQDWCFGNSKLSHK